MAWIIQSISQGPIVINDLGIMLTFNQTRDIDLVGRENSERSNDIKYFLAKGMIKTIRKDAYSQDKLDPALVQEIKNNSEEIKTATANLSKIEGSVDQAFQAAQMAQAAVVKMTGDIEEQKKQNEAILETNKKVLDAVMKFSEDHPVEIRKMKEAIENIKIERTIISGKQEALQQNTEMSEAEIKTQEKIMGLKDKRLEKNIKEIGKKIVKSDDSKDINDAISGLEDLGI
jgi:chromosome segregation ATPase